MTGDRNTVARPGKVGCWGIDLGVPGDGSGAAVTALATSAAPRFTAAFADLCEIESAFADYLAARGPRSAPAVVETRRVDVAADGNVTIPPDASVVIGLVLECAVRLETSDGVVSIPRAAEWRFAAVLAPEEEGLRVEDTAAYLCVGIDAWTPAARDPTARELAVRNAPRLERSLRDWERAMGHPITDYTSDAYPGAIGPYGFVPTS